MFILRCAFWLSVVYATLLWRGDYFREATSVVATPREAARSALDRAEAAVMQTCEARPAQCLDAARLTSLVRGLGKDRSEALAQDGTASGIEDVATRRPRQPR